MKQWQGQWKECPSLPDLFSSVLCMLQPVKEGGVGGLLGSDSLHSPCLYYINLLMKTVLTFINSLTQLVHALSHFLVSFSAVSIQQTDGLLHLVIAPLGDRNAGLCSVCKQL